MKRVMKLIGILIPGFEFAGYVFGIDNSQQNRKQGFVFKDKISKVFNFRKQLLLNLRPGNKASFLLLFTPHSQVSTLS